MNFGDDLHVNFIKLNSCAVVFALPQKKPRVETAPRLLEAKWLAEREELTKSLECSRWV